MPPFVGCNRRWRRSAAAWRSSSTRASVPKRPTSRRDAGHDRAPGVLDLRRTPSYSTGGRNTFLAGADVEAVFEAAAIGQTKRRVAVVLDRKELAAVSVDFGSLE